MKYDAELINRILQEYEDTRTANKARQRRRIDEVYKKLPRIEEIDREVAAVGATMTANIMGNPQNADEYKQNMQKDFARLKAEKEDILSQSEFADAYMELLYTCDACKDTGYIDNVRCKCFEQKLINAAYAESNLMSVVQNQNFATFSFDYYSDKVSEQDGESPLERIKSIYNIAKAFADNFDEYPKSLLFYGGSGLGKTFLSSCIAKEVLDSGKTVIYTSATSLFSLYEDYKFGRKKEDSIIQKAYEADLLIIDDLGTEYRSKNGLVEAFLFDLLNSRLLTNKKMIISTNYNMNELAKAYSVRFVSRIYEMFTPLKFLGEDIRVKKFSASI